MTAYSMWNQMVGQEIDGVELDGKVYSMDTIRAALTPLVLPDQVLTDEPCPACGAGRLRTANGGGVKCDWNGCSYWFCY